MRDRNIKFDLKRKQHLAPGDDASTAEAASGRVGGDERGKARRANITSNGGPHLERGRLRLITSSKSDFSIAETTGPTYTPEYIYTIFIFVDVVVVLASVSLLSVLVVRPLLRHRARQ